MNRGDLSREMETVKENQMEILKPENTTNENVTDRTLTDLNKLEMAEERVKELEDR